MEYSYYEIFVLNAVSEFHNAPLLSYPMIIMTLYHSLVNLHGCFELISFIKFWCKYNYEDYFSNAELIEQLVDVE